MKKILLFTLAALLSVSCGLKKEIAGQIAAGNYDRAINLSIKKLQKKRNHKKADAYVLLLEEAFAKAQKRDLKRIEQLKRDGNPENWKKIYELYNDLISRQERIEPLLPLRVVKENRNARFEFKDYMPGLLHARDQMVAYQYGKAKELLRYNDKKHIREAYDILEDIDRVYPNYKDVRRLMEEAHRRGTSFVGVIIENKNITQYYLALFNDDWNKAEHFSYNDTVGPTIELEYYPTNPTSDDDVTVYAQINDLSGISQAILSYQVDNGDWINVSMTYTNGNYTAVIPKQPADSSVRFKVYAEDNQGNWAVSNTISYTVQSAGEESEIPITYIVAAVIIVVIVFLVPKLKPKTKTKTRRRKRK